MEGRLSFQSTMWTISAGVRLQLEPTGRIRTAHDARCSGTGLLRCESSVEGIADLLPRNAFFRRKLRSKHFGALHVLFPPNYL